MGDTAPNGLRHVGALLLGVMLVAGAWYVLSSRTPVDPLKTTERATAKEPEVLSPVPVAPSPEQTDPEAPEDVVVADPVDPMPIEAPVTEERKAVAPAVFSGVLVDHEGKPVADALLSWTSYPEQIIENASLFDPGHWLLDDTTFENSTVWANAGPRGGFEFYELPPSAELPGPSVIWATHPDREALSILLDADPTTWPKGGRFEMSAAQGTLVRCVDVSGQPIPGALVRTAALVKPSRAFHEPVSQEKLVRLYLRRSAETGADGKTPIPPFPGERVLSAQYGDDVSEEWTGQRADLVELMIGASFAVGGSLIFSRPTEHVPGELSVTISGWRGGIPSILRQAPFDEDGLTWGPVQVPLGEYDSFSFALVAMTIDPKVHFLPRPVSGELLTVDFKSKRGTQTWFILEDENGTPLEEGTVDIFWESNEGVREASFKLRADGIVCAPCPDEYITSYRGTAPGFVSKTMLGFTVPEVEPVLHPITMLRGGSISGRCVFEGDPVENFEVVLWEAEDHLQVSRYRFREAEDGNFLIEGVPLGNILILGYADHQAPSNAQPVHVVSGAVEKVELLLQAPVELKGQVIDEQGLPVSAATIQVYTEDDRYLIANWGPPVTVTDSGGFELAGLPPGRVGFTVSAAGFSEVTEWAEILTDGQHAKKIVRLASLRDLELRLHFADGSDPTQYAVTVGRSLTEIEGYRSLGSDGVVKFPQVSAETSRLWLRSPSRAGTGIKLPRPAGRDWIVEYTIGGSGKLIVEVDQASLPDGFPEQPKVTLSSYVYGREVMVTYANLPESGEVVFGSLHPGRYEAKVHTGGISSYGSALVHVLEGQTTHATVVVGGADSGFRIVDKRGDPIPGVSLFVYDTTYPLWRRATTDGEGLCTISGAPAMKAFAGLQHPDFGDLWGAPVELGLGSDEVTELEFVAEFQVALVLLDGNTPLPGVVVNLTASDNRNVDLLSTRESDLSGRAHFQRLGKAVYGADIEGPLIWNKKLEVAASEGQETLVQVRRTGNLRFHLTGTSGAPLADIPITLTSLEFGTTAETWIEEGRLLTSPASTRTSVEGTLLFPAIPNGSYRWSIALPGIDAVEGIAQVPPGDDWTVEVILE